MLELNPRWKAYAGYEFEGRNKASSHRFNAGVSYAYLKPCHADGGQTQCDTRQAARAILCRAAFVSFRQMAHPLFGPETREAAEIAARAIPEPSETRRSFVLFQLPAGEWRVSYLLEFVGLRELPALVAENGGQPAPLFIEAQMDCFCSPRHLAADILLSTRPSAGGGVSKRFTSLRPSAETR